MPAPYTLLVRNFHEKFLQEIKESHSIQQCLYNPQLAGTAQLKASKKNTAYVEIHLDGIQLMCFRKAKIHSGDSTRNTKPLTVNLIHNKTFHPVGILWFKNNGQLFIENLPEKTQDAELNSKLERLEYYLRRALSFTIESPDLDKSELPNLHQNSQKDSFKDEISDDVFVQNAKGCLWEQTLITKFRNFIADSAPKKTKEQVSAEFFARLKVFEADWPTSAVRQVFRDLSFTSLYGKHTAIPVHVQEKFELFQKFITQVPEDFPITKFEVISESVFAMAALDAGMLTSHEMINKILNPEELAPTARRRI